MTAVVAHMARKSKTPSVWLSRFNVFWSFISGEKKEIHILCFNYVTAAAMFSYTSWKDRFICILFMLTFTFN